MKVKFYQVFENKGQKTVIKLNTIYKIKHPIKIIETKTEGLFIIPLNDHKRRELAKKILLVSKSQVKQLQISLCNNSKEVTITEIYKKSELKNIISYWNPSAIRLYQSTHITREFCRIAEYVLSNLGGDFFGKFILPTPTHETFNCDLIAILKRK